MVIVKTGLRGLILAIALSCSGSEIARWDRFRGRDGSGVSESGRLPVYFSPESNVVWRSKTPYGHSSPCISGDKIFITGESNGMLETLAIDRGAGEIVWRRSIKPETLEKPSRIGSLANPTPATDGERVYVYFGSYGLICYDVNGNEIWKKPLAIPITQHGTGVSPVLTAKNVILLCDQDINSYLLAVDKMSGETVWKVERRGFRRGFSTPLVLKHGVDELIITAGTLKVVAYRAVDGSEVWSATGVPNEVCGSPISGDRLIFAGGWTYGTGGSKFSSFDETLKEVDTDKDGKISDKEATSGAARQHFQYIDANKDGFITREEWETIAEIFRRSENAILAIRLGGKGDITKTHVAYKITRGLPYVPTPLYYRGRLWLIRNGGLISCYDGKNGEPIFQEERIGVTGDYYASPIGGDGKIYVASQSGTVTVIEAGDSLNVLARNKMNEQIMATPAIVDGVIYLRTTGNLFAIAENK